MLRQKQWVDEARAILASEEHMIAGLKSGEETDDRHFRERLGILVKQFHEAIELSQAEE